MNSVAYHVMPAGEGDGHFVEGCPWDPEIEIKTREDGRDGVVVVHRAFAEEEAA